MDLLDYDCSLCICYWGNVPHIQSNSLHIFKAQTIQRLEIVQERCLNEIYQKINY